MSELELFKGKPGPGRPKGSKSRWTLRREAAAKLALENPGESPLDFLLSIMRDEDIELGVRIDCAKACMPAMHPRLQAIKVQDERKPEIDFTPDQLYGELINILLQSGAINPALLTPVNPPKLIEATAEDVTEDESL